MNDRTLQIATAVLALAGAAVTSYLLYVRQSGAQLVCATGGCETVQSSRYSELLGMPVAAFGLAAYVMLFLTSVSRDELGRMVQTVVALAAVAFSHLPRLRPAPRDRGRLRLVPGERRAHVGARGGHPTPHAG